MKKVKLFISALVLGLALVSCSGIDSKLDAYEKACQEKDLVEMTKLAGELGEVLDEMTDEQAKRLESIVLECN